MITNHLRTGFRVHVDQSLECSYCTYLIGFVYPLGNGDHISHD